MSEESNDKSIDSTSKDTFITPAQAQPDQPFVHMLLQNKPHTRPEDDLEATEKRRALRLQVQQGAHALPQDELDTSKESPAVLLDPISQHGADAMLEEDPDTTVKLPPIWLQRIRLQEYWLQQPDANVLHVVALDTVEEFPVVRLEPPQQGAHALPEAKKFSTVRTSFYQWIKTNIVILVNAGSLIGTTAVTSVLGFAYWWVAARWFPPEAVGLGSATISVMTLLGMICMLGLGTLLIGELPRQKGKEGPLISAALIVAGGAGTCAGVIFALLAPFVAADFQVLRAGIEALLLFAVGVSLTAITLVLDQALIGLLRGEVQLWRNTLFAVAKLAALFVVSLWLSQKAGLAIYTTWLVGNALSLAVLAGYVIWKEGWSRRTYLPQWELLRKLGPAALQHHILNLMLQLPPLVLPVLVTMLLSATVNAWFYVSYMLANFIFLVSYALTTTLYATSSANPAILARKARLTLALGAVTAILANCVFQFGTGQVLGVFGHSYAEQAAWSLRILALGGFPYIIRGHYVAICRVRGRLLQAILPIAACTLTELSAAALGARLGGLSGLSLGWVAALCAEAAFLSPTVYKAVRPRDISTNIDQFQRYPLQHGNKQMADTNAFGQ